MSEIKVDKISPQSGTALQIGDASDVITIPASATITNLGTANGFGGGATPVLWVHGSSVSCPNGTPTKITFATEVLDTQTAFDNSTNHRFTPSSGYYLFTGLLRFASFPASAGNDTCGVMLYKNGSAVAESYDDQTTSGANSLPVVSFQEANGSDYFELWAYQATGGAINVQSGIAQTYFQALKVS